MCASETTLQWVFGHIFIRRHQRQSQQVLASEMVGVEDAVEIAVMKVFSVQNVPYMCIFGRNQSSPRNTPIA